jgi:hypothetical protein
MSEASDLPDLAEAKRIVLRGLIGRSAKVYLFGSFARGAARRSSDIDIAIETADPLEPHVLSEIRDALEESDILRQVDLVDLRQASESLRRRVMEEGVVWEG